LLIQIEGKKYFTRSRPDRDDGVGGEDSFIETDLLVAQAYSEVVDDA